MQGRMIVAAARDAIDRGGRRADAQAFHDRGAVDVAHPRGRVFALMGQETSAASLCMGIRRIPLPGENVPARSTRSYAGDMHDTPALERWIAGP